MSRNPLRQAPAGKVPSPRSAVKVPKQRAQGQTPRAHTPSAHVGRAPTEHPAGKVPNPRKATLVRDVHGGDLKDLFVIFPDLPRPARPPRRVPISSVQRPRLR